MSRNITGVASQTVTGASATNLITAGAAHKLVAGDRVRFSALTGGTGLSINTNYFVIASGLTATVLKVSATLGGAEIDFTTDVTAGTMLTNIVTTEFGNSFRVGTQVQLKAIAGGTGLANSTPYFVISIAGQDFRLSATKGGIPVWFTTTLTGGNIRRVLLAGPGVMSHH